MLECLFDRLDKHRVTDAENEAAARLFRRVGSRREGHLREHVRFKGACGSEFLFAVLAAEWRDGAG